VRLDEVAEAVAVSLIIFAVFALTFVYGVLRLYQR